MSDAGSADDEIVYELGDWTADERTDLEGRLNGSGIAFRWEEDEDLVVAATDERAVEALLDELEFPDQLEPVAEGDEIDDDAVYSVMSDLFLTADRLKDDPEDPDRVTDFCNAADAASAAPAPFGIEAQVWTQVQEVALSLRDAIDADADPDVLSRDARSLRQLLTHYV